MISSRRWEKEKQKLSRGTIYETLNTLVYECDTFLLSMRSASCFWKCLSLSCFSRSASCLCRDSSSSFCYTNISRRVLHRPDETVWREWRTPLIWPVSGAWLPPLSLSDSALPPASSPPPPSTFCPPLPDAEPPPLSLLAPLLCAEPFPPWLACDQISRKSLVCLAALGPAMCTLSTPRLLLLLPALLLLPLPLFAGQPAVLSQDPACLLWVCGACRGLVEWRTDHTLWKQERFKLQLNDRCDGSTLPKWNWPVAAAGSLLGLFWPTGWGRGSGGLRTCFSSSCSSVRLLACWGLSGVILTGRMFPGSSAPGDLTILGVGGRPVGFWGGLHVGWNAD